MNEKIGAKFAPPPLVLSVGKKGLVVEGLTSETRFRQL